jgi:hypothetical protein
VLRKKLFLAVVIAAAFAMVAQTANADVYDITFTTLKGSYLETLNADGTVHYHFDFDPDDPVVLRGTWDSDTELLDLQLENCSFPDGFIETPFGTITVRTLCLTDVTGTLSATDGSAVLYPALQIRLSGDGVPPNCRIDRIALTLTTGTSGLLIGSPYVGPSPGTITLVDALASAPAVTECGFFYGPLFNAYFGLPAPSGRLHVKLVAQLEGLPF